MSEKRILKLLTERDWQTILMLNDRIDYLEELLVKSKVGFKYEE